MLAAGQICRLARFSGAYVYECFLVYSYTCTFSVLCMYWQVLCNMQCAMNYCLIVVSMMTLGFVSIDRFIHIIYPLRYPTIVTISRIRMTIIWTWIQGAIIGKYRPLYVFIWINISMSLENRFNVAILF